MNRWRGAQGEVRGLLRGDAVEARLVWPALLRWLARFPGSVGAFLADSGRPLGSRLAGVSVDAIYPLPWVPRARSEQRALFGKVLPDHVLAHCQLILAMLNWLHGGPWFEVCRLRPSAAQGRVLATIGRNALQADSSATGARTDWRTIRGFLHLDLFGYGARRTAKPLGIRAGVPDEAARCDPAEALRGFDDQLADLVRDPGLLMKTPAARPEPRRPFVYVDNTYGDLVSRAVGVGLQDWGAEAEAVAHQGVAQHSGGFAVEKDEREDRWISPLEFANDCVQDELLPTMVAPYVPQLGGGDPGAGLPA